MLADRWKVVRLYKYKKADVLSTHWWRWSATWTASCWLWARPNDVIDVWRI